MREVIDRRILGAIRFVDISTGAAIARPLRLTSDKLSFVLNRRGDYAITRAEHPDLLKHIDSFRDIPAEPAAAVTFGAEVKDPAGEYLPRAFTVKLPRDPNPEHAANADSLFRPVEIALLSSPNRGIAANWCAVRASVENDATDAPVARAGVRVRWGDPQKELLGMTDEQGESLIAIAGLPFHTTSKDPDTNKDLILTEVDATLEAFAHKQGGAATPELIAANDAALVKSAPVAIKIAPGRSISRRVLVTIPNA